MFIDEFLTDGFKKDGGFQYTNYNGKCIVVEGIKDLLLSTTELVVVKLAKGELQVKGKNLLIKELSKSVVCVCGTVESIETI